MIIVSQDRRSIVNFDRVKTIELDRETNFITIFAYIGEGNSTAFKHLGGYETEERAREVLEDIASRYEYLEDAKAGAYKIDISEQNFKYEMPLE